MIHYERGLSRSNFSKMRIIINVKTHQLPGPAVRPYHAGYAVHKNAFAVWSTIPRETILGRASF